METADDETEEELVYFKFDSMFDKEVFNPHVNFKLIGLDTDEPVVQLGAQVFTGKWEMATGTCIFFAEDHNYHSDDPIFNEPSKINVKYVSKTRKMLRMNRTILTRKSSEGTSNSIPDSTTNKDTDGPSVVEETETEKTASNLRDVAEMESELSVEDIQRISLEPSEIDPLIIDKIMET